ncbi:transporter [Geomonas edaphica]|uniref:transporter n=1 Tax=Geomonas edaphica TaxID=2570226 RepID=UPI0010A848AB|nr:transporter [Geomonas edaphica]
MTNKLHRCKVWFGLLLAAAFAPPVPAMGAGPAVSASLGFEFASGDYGTGTTTRSLYVPFTLTVAPTERLGFSLEVPYVYQSNSSVNTGVLLGSSGQVGGMRKETAAMSGSMGGSSSGSGGGSMSSATPDNYGRSASGVGDVTAKAGYVLVEEGELMPRIRPYLSVKFPTGDKGSALGTGSFDEGAAVEFFKQLGNWYSFAELGYTFQGHSSVLPLKDYASFNAGTGYAVTEKLLPMLIVKTSSAPISGGSDLLETRLKLKYLATKNTGIEAYAGKGWTRSSPDFTSGVSITYDF